jgi:hypothetical protein
MHAIFVPIPNACWEAISPLFFFTCPFSKLFEWLRLIFATAMYWKIDNMLQAIYHRLSSSNPCHQNNKAKTVKNIFRLKSFKQTTTWFGFLRHFAGRFLLSWTGGCWAAVQLVEFLHVQLLWDLKQSNRVIDWCRVKIMKMAYVTKSCCLTYGRVSNQRRDDGNAIIYSEGIPRVMHDRTWNLKTRNLT